MNSLSSNSGWVPQTLIVDRIDSGFYRKTDIDNLKKLYDSNIMLKTLTSLSTKITDGPHDGYDFVEKGVLFIRSQNIKDAGFDFSDKKYINKEFHSKFQKSWLEEGDLLITRIGHYYGNAAVVLNSYVGSNINHAIALVKLKKEINPYFVCAYINSSIGYQLYRRLGKSFTSPRVNLSDFDEYLVPVPSKITQNYIGEKIRKSEYLRVEAMNLKNETENLIDKYLMLDNLRSKINLPNVKQKWNYVTNDEFTDRLDPEHYKIKFSILNEHFEQLRKMNINVINLKDIIEKGSYGILPSSSDYGKGELTLIRSTDLKNYMINFDSCEKVPLEYNVEKARVSSGEILLEIKGSISGGAIVPKRVNEGIVNGSIYKFSVKEEFNNYYILAILQSLIGELQKEQHGANSVISYLSLEVIHNLQIPVLPKNIQDYIGGNLERYVTNLIKAKELVENAKQDVESLIDGNLNELQIHEN